MPIEQPSSTSLLTEATSAFASEAQLLQETHTTRSVAVSQRLKLPPFSRNCTTAWFQRAEVHFRIANLTDESAKADQVMAILPEEIFAKISTWLETSEGPIRYEALKGKLTEIYSLPVTERAQRVLDLINQPLGESTVMEAWDELKGLLLLPGYDEDGRRREISLSGEILLRRLPQNVRAGLTDTDSLEMDDLVKRAQSLHEAAKASTQAAAHSVNQVDEDSPDEDSVYMVGRRNWPPKKKYDGPSKKRNEDQSWCRFHKKFGKDAWRCVPPCSYKTKN